MERQQDETQQMAYFMQYAEEQLKELEMQHQVIEQGIQDITGTMITIENLDKEQADKSGTMNVILPVGAAGGFIRTTIQKPKMYIVSIGARYFMEADYSASAKILQSQKDKMTSTIGIIEQRMKQLTEQAEKIRPVLEQRLQAMKSGGEGAGETTKAQNKEEEEDKES
nr:prefoldin subunit alpha [Candidatus Sigynarchaeota archaeon]